MCGADRRWSHGETVSGWRCPHRPGNGFGTATGTSPPRSVRGAVSRSAHRGGPEICRPAGACLRFGSQPTAHAVGYRLPVLRTWCHGSARELSPGAKMGLAVQSPTPLKHPQLSLGPTRCNISGKTSAYSAKSPSTVNTGISSRIATAQIRKSVPPPWIPLLRHALYSRAADT
jgi:hypothetical protein